MRKLIFGINTTLDGCCDHTKVAGEEEVLDYFAALLRDVDELIYGRKTYELMVPYWPDAAKNPFGLGRPESEFAQAFAAIPRITVFSRTLGKPESKNTRIARGDLKEEVLRLKQQEGKDISVGGVDLPSQLIELGLVDEFHFVVQPLLVGEGRRLLQGVSLNEKLKLVESTPFRSGTVALRYTKQ